MHPLPHPVLPAPFLTLRVRLGPQVGGPSMASPSIPVKAVPMLLVVGVGPARHPHSWCR